MNAIWTMLSVSIFLGGTLGPSGVMTGTHALFAMALAIFVYGGFVAIDALKNKFHANAGTKRSV